jgi:hypothetical protein
MAMASGLGSTENHEKGKHNNIIVAAHLGPTRLPGDATKADSGMGKNAGQLDHIFDVLKKYKHPFILVVMLPYTGCGSVGLAHSSTWSSETINSKQSPQI